MAHDKETRVRIQSKIQVTVGKTVIGGPDPLICIPLVAADKHALLDQAAALPPLSPDIVEWRVDSFQGAREVADCLATLDTLRAVIGDIPLIFTCRSEAEGGMQPIGPTTRLALIEAAIRSGGVDIVDVELINGKAFIDTVRRTADDKGVKVILSHHDFRRTPDQRGIVETLTQAQKQGADIAKVAVMPTGPADVLALLQATFTARTQAVTIPLITIAMAAKGVVSRIAGGLFGSDITFAAGRTASAPGQIPIGDLRQAMSLLYD